MKSTGIVVEYNPFHYGHHYHITQARLLSGAEVVIAVMSPSFVQRGIPAITSKKQRVLCALQQGVDLVFELPLSDVLQRSDIFASSAIHLLERAKVSSVVFGSECGELSQLTQLAQTPLDQNDLFQAMRQGIAYPKALSKQLGSLAPNDLLAIAYLRALQDTKITPYVLKRTTDYHEEIPQTKLTSATAIRHGWIHGSDMSAYTPMVQPDHLFLMTDLWPFIRYRLLSSEPQQLATLFLVDEGIAGQLIKQAQKYTALNDFLNACISRRYTRARILRTLTHILLNHQRTMIDSLPQAQHLRLLGFTPTGRRYLKEHHIQVISRYRDIPQPWRDLEMRAVRTLAMTLSPEAEKN